MCIKSVIGLAALITVLFYLGNSLVGPVGAGHYIDICGVFDTILHRISHVLALAGECMR